jgi:hypothetical protein
VLVLKFVESPYAVMIAVELIPATADALILYMISQVMSPEAMEFHREVYSPFWRVLYTSHPDEPAENAEA